VYWEWKLLGNSCTGCGICFDVCPVEAITMAVYMALPESVPDKCTGCMTCVDECPFEAINVKEGETR